jgi:hypothetical protein
MQSLPQAGLPGLDSRSEFGEPVVLHCPMMKSAGERRNLSRSPMHHLFVSIWVTNWGSLLLLDGGLEGDRMVLTETEQAKDGTSSLLRGIWHREGAAVRETAERSSDGGKTWNPVFDILFRKHRAAGGP